MNQAKLEVIYDHYNSTFDLQLKYLNQRNKYFILLLVLGTVLFFQIANLNAIDNLIDGFIKSNVSDTVNVDTNFIHSILIFSILWTLMLYFQVNSTIRTQYKYLHKLEKELSLLLKPFELDREGSFYRKYLTSHGKLSKIIYVYFFPIFILITVISSGVKTFQLEEDLGILIFFDFLIYFLIVILSLLYIFKK